ncbi:MAG TPA: hypothetical protein VL068_02085 [Microthrixaceae bacterium]|nr:hypothetical protein [Microthrixaceae bacterium]
MNPVSTDRDGPSIWAFVAGFLVLAVVGLTLLLVLGSPAGKTRPTGTPPWEDPPKVAESGSGSTADMTGKGETRAVPTTAVTNPSTGNSADPGSDPGSGKGIISEDATTPVTFPDGRPAPTGVTEVLRQDGTISLSFAVTSDRLGDNPQTLVPPMKTRVSDDGTHITVWVSCARSSRESLAQVSVSETAQIVTVAGVVIVPANAVGCDPSAKPRELVIPLQSPAGNRSVVVLPTSTKLPDIKPG